MVDYMLYVFTELNELAEDSEEANANDMNSKSKKRAKSLIREILNAVIFLQDNLEDISERDLKKCKSYRKFEKLADEDKYEEFYQDMFDEIEEEYPSIVL